MALFNEILVGRYNRFLQKLLSLKGGPPAPQLSTEIQPSLGLFSGVENKSLEGWGLYGAGFVFNGVAAQVNAIRLRNPTTSGVVAVIQRLAVSSGATDEFSVTSGQALIDLGSVVSLAGNYFDNRTGVRPNGGPACILSQTQGAAPAALGAAFQWERSLLLANTPYQLILTDNQEIPLLPSDGIQVVNNVVNIGTRVMFLWRERALEDSEKS